MQVDAVRKVSLASTSLCVWVHAVDVYCKVEREVAPKRQRLDEMNKALAEANAQLAAKQVRNSAPHPCTHTLTCTRTRRGCGGGGGVTALCCRLQEELGRALEAVNHLQRQCDVASAEKARLERESDNTRARLLRAERLTHGLGAEGARWKQQAHTVADEVRGVDRGVRALRALWRLGCLWVIYCCACVLLVAAGTHRRGRVPVRCVCELSWCIPGGIPNAAPPTVAVQTHGSFRRVLA